MKTKRIVVVNIDGVVSDKVVTNFSLMGKTMGYTMETKTDISSLLHALYHHPDDTVVVNFCLPEERELVEVALQAQEETTNIPLFALSPCADDALLESVSSHCYLSTPADLRTLFRLIDGCLEAH